MVRLSGRYATNLKLNRSIHNCNVYCNNWYGLSPLHSGFLTSTEYIRTRKEWEHLNLLCMMLFRQFVGSVSGTRTQFWWCLAIARAGPSHSQKRLFIFSKCLSDKCNLFRETKMGLFSISISGNRSWLDIPCVPWSEFPRRALAIHNNTLAENSSSWQEISLSGHIHDASGIWGDRKSRETRMADRWPRKVSRSGLAAVKDLPVIYSFVPGPMGTDAAAAQDEDYDVQHPTLKKAWEIILSFCVRLWVVMKYRWSLQIILDGVKEKWKNREDMYQRNKKGLHLVSAQ